VAKGKKSKVSKSHVNPQLDGFEVSIDKFGEIKSTLNIDRINDFLDKEVKDKKLIDRDKAKGKDDQNNNATGKK